MERKPYTDLKVFIANRDSSCDECGENLGRRAWITLTRDKGVLCLACGDLDHLAFLPSGDAALTRRTRKYSGLVAVVLKWNRARKRYERQGLLVEAQALEQAEEECLADGEARARRGEREAARRAQLNHEYVKRFASRVHELFLGARLEEKLPLPNMRASSTAGDRPPAPEAFLPRETLRTFPVWAGLQITPALT